MTNNTGKGLLAFRGNGEGNVWWKELIYPIAKLGIDDGKREVSGFKLNYTVSFRLRNARKKESG